jgi:hypothetical protein
MNETENDLRYIRLNNGENVVSSLTIVGKMYKLTKPLHIYIENIDTKPTLIMLPWIPQQISDSVEVTVKISDVLYIVPLAKEISTYIDRYSEMLYSKKSQEEASKTKSDIEDAMKSLYAYASSTGKKLQ